MKFVGTWGLVILSAFCDTSSAFIMKHRFNEVGNINFSSVQNLYDYVVLFMSDPLLILAAIAFVGGPGIWFVALNRLEVTRAYPVNIAFHFFFIFFFGTVFLSESIDVNKVLGCILVFSSFFLLSKNKKIKKDKKR